MANAEQVQRLTQDVGQWNTWRKEHPEIKPDLIDADLSEADLSEADLSEADLSGADLSGVNLSGVNLSGVNLRRAGLLKANLNRADLSEADLSEADLNGANLFEADLSEADLREAELNGADLNGADLFKVNLSGANLFEADLREADLREANLREADLSRADLSRADLREADLSGANLSGANLFEAILRLTSIAKIDMRTVTGMSTIWHMGPSHIELFSVQLPQDGSALHFLRGVGVPDEWIDDYRARMMHPIQYHSCFLSYTSTDEELAKRLHADLQAEGVRCWFAPHDMKIGNKIRQRIDEAIHLQDKLLLILSRDSVASDWVEYEVETALSRERKEHREILFPVRIDESIVEADQAWAKLLYSTRHIGDFTRWEQVKAYQVAFARLLRDLKQEG